MSIKKRLICLVVSLAMLSMCVMSSCTEEDADELFDLIFGKDWYVTEGDTLTDEVGMIMHVIDIGQGDCSLIQCGTMNVLIDCGENGMGETVLEYLDKIGVDHIDWLIATHPHSDHIGGMDTVINSKNITIDHMMMPQTAEEMTPTTKTYTDLLKAVEKKKLKITVPTPGKTYDLDGVEMLVLSPKKKSSYDDLNEYSIVLKFTYNDISILTGGDSTKNNEKELLNSKYDLDADIFKVSHHGGKESNSKNFLKAVSPEYSVISCGTDNSYGHPKQVVLDNLTELGSNIHRTDLDGTVIYKTDGVNIAVATSK